MTVKEMDVEVRDDSGLLAAIYAGISVSIVLVTPQLAAEMLQRNNRNRPLNKRHVTFLSSTMLFGDYVFNGETIVFDKNGDLLDGQHRLHAIIESGVSIAVLVVRGVDPSVFDTLDAGRARTTGEVLAMEGETNSNAIAGAVSQFVQFIDRGGVMYSAGSGGSARKATPRLTARILAAHPGLRDSVAALQKSPVYKNQQGYVLHYLFGIVDSQLAEQFAAVLCNGSSDVGRPFNVIRETLIRTPLTTAARKGVAAKVIKAFNAERVGERPKMFRFDDREEFPTIDGLDYDWLASSVG